MKAKIELKNSFIKTDVMKKLVFLMTLLTITFSLTAQETSKLSRKEKKFEKEAIRKAEVEKLLTNKTFVFNATNALPMGGKSVQLGYYFFIEIKGDTVNSYLPFYGVAYNVDYGSRNSPFDFKNSIKDYLFEKDKNAYRISFEVKNKMDLINFRFNISEIGYASLHVSSTNRRSISYYGTIDKIEMDAE